MAGKNATTISEHFGQLSDEIEGGFSLPKMWKLKSKICPKRSDVPTATKDSAGNLISNKKGIMKLYETTYKEQLSKKRDQI